jgi:hypothetical protein
MVYFYKFTYNFPQDFGKRVEEASEYFLFRKKIACKECDERESNVSGGSFFPGLTRKIPS